MGKKNRKKKQQPQATKNIPEPRIKNTSNNKQKLWLSIFLGVFAFILYSNTLKNDFAFDDALAISENTIVQKGIPAIPEIMKTNYVAGHRNGTSTMYRPFTLSVFAIEWSISPNDPYIGHLVNCLFYAFTAMLLFFVLSRLFLKQPLLIPFLATLLFVIHPIHTEVVANIKSLDEIMVLFFCLLSFLFLLRYADLKKKSSLIFAGLFYFSALMFKENAVPMIIIFPLLLYFFTGANKKNYVWVMLTMGAVLIVQLLIRNNVLENQTGNIAVFLKIHNSLVGANGFGEKSASIFMIQAHYLRLLFFPYPLSSDYSFNQIPLVNWDSPWAILSLCIHAGLILICILRFRKKETWVFGIIFYLVSMILFSNIFILVGATIGERFLYTPSVGFCIAVASLLALAVDRKKAASSFGFIPAIGHYKIPVIIILIAAILGSLKTVDRNADWENSSTLFEADIKKSPNSAQVNYWYGNDILRARALPQKDMALKKKIIDTVLLYINKAISIYPDYGDAYSSRGLANLRSGREAEAIADFYKSISYETAPWSLYNNLGVIYGNRKMYDSALYCFNRALKLDSKQALPQKNIGNIMEFKNDFQSAIVNYHKALEINNNTDLPLQKEIYSQLAFCYFRTGDSIKGNNYKNLSLQ